MPINKNEITKETIEKAMACQTPEELMEFAKANGHVMTKEEAEAYLAELADIELDSEMLKDVAGGVCWKNCSANDPNCGIHTCGIAGWTNFNGC